MAGGGSLEIFPLANYASGTRTLGPRTIPGQISTLTFALARCTTPDQTIWQHPIDKDDPIVTTIAVNVEASYDGGVTWQSIGGCTSQGGIAPGRFGGELAETSLVMQFPGPQSVQARMTLTVAGGPLRSVGTLRWT